MSGKIDDFDGIDEAEEEALLKSDDDDEMPTLEGNAKKQIRNDATLMTEEKLLEEDEHDNVDDNAVSMESNDGDTDTDDEENSSNAFNNILKEIEQNKYDYDKYVQLCNISHTTDDLDNIRKAYRLFSSVYPLSAEIWLKYLKVESQIAHTAKEIENLIGLYQKAFNDYFSIDVAIEYASLANRIADAERIWNYVLGTYGLHCLEGQKIYQLYRKFIADNQQLSSNDKQDAYIQSYLRELKCPLENMEESYIAFKVFWEQNKNDIPNTHDVNWDTIDRYYYQAKEHLQNILPFEKQLLNMDAKAYRERADVYISYIKAANTLLDENILQTIYERMVADCCLNVDCWLKYINFIEYRDEYGRPEELQELPIFQQTAVDITARALRNCPWSEKLYIKKMLLLEKQEKTREDIQEVLESSLSAGFQSAEPVVAIWIEYLTYLRRHTDWQNDGECEILRKNFNLAWTILGQQFGVLADYNCEILQFWGRLEYGPLQNPKRGKELWSTVMESSNNATKSGLWIEFIELEIGHDLEATRKLYRKSLKSTEIDNPLVLTTAWERFERCNGNIKTLHACKNECDQFLAAVQKRQQQSNFVAEQQTYTKSSRTARTTTKRKLSDAGREDFPEKKLIKKQERKSATESDKAESKVKQKDKRANSKEREPQEDIIDPTKDHLRVFLSNLDYNLTEDEIRQGLSQLNINKIDLIRSVNGKSRGFGYLELQTEADVEKALKMDREILNGRPMYISRVLRDKEKRQKFKYADSLEPTKLFIKGLPSDATAKDLDEIFSSYGQVKEIRLVYHKSGKFKNIAYVEYEDESSARKALLSTNDMELRGHILSVALSNPPTKSQTATSHEAVKLLETLAKRNKSFEQKPRMSFIPNSVRRQFAASDSTSVTSISTTSTPTNGAVTAGKSNEDFRKLLFK